jgi:uncharacterized protein (TIGR02271 family)
MMPHLVELDNENIDQQYSLEGYDCYDATGEKIGDIDGILADSQSMEPRYVILDMGGWFNTKRYVVPIGEISRQDDNERHLYFDRLSKDMLKSGQFPEYNDEWLQQEDDTRFNRFERDYARAAQPQGTAVRGDTVDYNDRMYRPQAGVQRLTLLQEHLRANKERYQAGVVKLGKRVTERQETVEVPVTEEHVVIERRPLEGRVDETSIGRDQTVEVPVTREKVNVEKAVEGEEVVARKEQTQRTERVQDTVRREELQTSGDQQLVRDQTTAREGPRPDTTSGTPAPERSREYRPEGPTPTDEATRRAQERRP